MRTEMLELIGSDGTVLPGQIWLPEGDLKAVLQITHGMTEHIGRYESFAEILTAQNIAVAGFDLRGHGKNPGDLDVASFGEGGWKISIQDMRLWFQSLEQRFCGVPKYMLGFSLGSFLLREYLTQYPAKGEISGAIIMGTGYQPSWMLSMIISIVKSQIKKAGFDKTTDLVRKLSFGTYNRKFSPNRTAADWLCADTQELDQYLSDPLVRKDISAGLFFDLLKSMKRTGNVAEYAGWDPNLPILLISGQDDPVGDGGKGVRMIYQHMIKAGLQKVTMKLYPGARHDLLHEMQNGGEEVQKYIAQWIIETVI